MRYLGPAAEVKTVKRVLKNPVGIGDTFMLVRALRCAIRSMTGYGTRLRGVPFRWRQKRASQLSCATVPYPYGLLTNRRRVCVPDESYGVGAPVPELAQLSIGSPRDRSAS